MTASEIINFARHLLETDEEIPLSDFRIEWKPWCTECRRPCRVLLLDDSIPMSDCCRLPYCLDLDVLVDPHQGRE